MSAELGQPSIAETLFPSGDTDQAKAPDEPGTVPEAGDTPDPDQPAGTLLRDALKDADSDFWSHQVAVGDDGELATIEALKDAYTGRKRTDAKASKLSEREREFKAEQLQYRRELSQAARALTMPGGLTQENLRTVQQFEEQLNAQQDELVKQVAPDALSDERQAQLAKMAGQYIGADELKQIRHAGIRLILDDWLDMRLRLKAIEKKTPKPKGQTPQTGKPAEKSAQRKVADGEMSQQAAIGQLLFGNRN